jgi:secondary thiamine-phosphate synthase enzyme
MPWLQKRVSLAPRARGCHLITREVLEALPELGGIRAGLLHVFIQHTSASLTINENADGDVRVDLESSLGVLAPEDFPYVHTLEGPDDMPAHVKTMLTGVSLHVPVMAGKLALGTWQGIYLVEHRTRRHSREVVLQFIGSRQQR